MRWLTTLALVAALLPVLGGCHKHAYRHDAGYVVTPSPGCNNCPPPGAPGAVGAPAPFPAPPPAQPFAPPAAVRPGF